MKFVRRSVVDDDTLISSSLAEDTSSAWNVGTSYAIGDLVHDPVTHRRYESQINANVGNDPAADDGTRWIDVGPTNRWGMFDEINGTFSEDADEIAVEVSVPGRADTVALLGLLGATAVNITAMVDMTEVYNQDFDLADYTGISDYWTYCFEEHRYKRDLIVSDLPLYSGMTIIVTVTGGASVRVGNCVIGQSRQIGDTALGMRLGINDRSKKGEDDFGRPIIVPRAYSRRGSFTVYVTGNSRTEVEGKVDSLIDLLAEYRATPVLWVGSESYRTTAIYGFYQSFEVEIAYTLQSVCTLSIEGLV